ncbi:uncharacterized protein LAJ45_03784 [Morchella importuna]|uniref:uncharacterized protein n=1 Tax=Morchella importuna TaxID=1174673 RepID=UPI001E8DF5A6|nr:uncharacterized protein LAJ45_03784 [Morchella importuna]KAH8152357.1 hypothetical protein LAJ45_03784 [Morchella importuna]
MGYVHHHGHREQQQVSQAKPGWGRKSKQGFAIMTPLSTNSRLRADPANSLLNQIGTRASVWHLKADAPVRGVVVMTCGAGAMWQMRRWTPGNDRWTVSVLADRCVVP